jgi:hypothetical protein
MNFRALIALLFAATLVGTPVFAQNAGPQNAGKDSTQRADRNALVQSLAKGQAFTSDGTPYQFLPEVQVLRMSKRETPQQALPQVGARTTDLLAQQGRLAVIRRAAAKGITAARVESINQRNLLPAALNTQTQQFGMLTGNILVKPKGMAQAAQLASDHGLSLSGDFAHLGIAYYEVKAGHDVLAATAALAADPRVTSAEPEVIERLHEPR